MSEAELPVSLDELLRPRHRDERVPLAGSAVGIGAWRAVSDRVDLLEELAIARRLCGDETVSRVAGDALARLRRVDR